MLGQMRHIQHEMDDLFRDSTKDFGIVDKDFVAMPSFDASAAVQDRGDAYVATFNLPKSDIDHATVNLKDDVLSVKAGAEDTTKSKPVGNNGQSSETEVLNQYEQLVTLPGPVDSAKLTVDKQGDSLIVTIPKKENGQTAAK